MKGRKLLLLFAILAAGGLIEAAFALRLRFDVGPTGIRLLGGRFYGPSFEFTQQEQIEPSPEPLRLRVNNAFGQVRVTGGPPGAPRVTLRKVIFQATREQASRFADRLHLETRHDGPLVTLTTNRDALERGVGRDVGFETHLEVVVPAGVDVEIDNAHGAVEVRDAGAVRVRGSYEPVVVERAAGNVRIKQRHGSVRVVQVAGGLRVRSRHASVDVERVTGAVDLDLHRADVRLSDSGPADVQMRYGALHAERLAGRLVVRGRQAQVTAAHIEGHVDVKTSHRPVELRAVSGDVAVDSTRGRVHVEAVRGRLSVSATYGDIRLSDIAGALDVDVRHGSLRAHDTRGGGQVKASGDDVHLEGFRGPFEIVAGHADVHLTPGEPLLSRLQVSSRRGDIHLGVPAGSRFNIEAATERGRLTGFDLPGLALDTISSRRAAGRLGDGGNIVRLHTRRGDIVIEVRDEPARKRNVPAAGS